MRPAAGRGRAPRGTLSGVTTPVDLRLRDPSPELLGLPWLTPLAEWTPDVVALRDIPVGPSRHLVRFVALPDGLLAVKEAPGRIVRKEYDVLRALETRHMPAVRPMGMVLRSPEEEGLLLTRYLDRSWQYRRLFMRLPLDATKQRGRLLAAMASLLVELHRSGVFWGDCSLANTLFMRDGQTLQAHLVDAETSEILPRLSDGQRQHDLDIVVENVAGGLIDIATRLGAENAIDEMIEAAESVAETYRGLWHELHHDLVVRLDERWQVDSRLRRLRELGYAVDEVRLETVPGGGDRLRVKVTVAGHDYHAEELRRLTGLAAGEGQADVLLNDVRAFAGRLQPPEDDDSAGRRWRREVYEPLGARASAVAGAHTDAIQAYCDFLEVRWLLSEQKGRDVGDEAALSALRARRTPVDSAASMSILEMPTGEMKPIVPGERDPDLT
jgi:hypothetical protein